MLLLVVTVSVSAGQKTEKILVAGEDLDLDCKLEAGDVEDAGLVVWKHGERVLFAGNLRIRRDYRMAIINNRFVDIISKLLRMMRFGIDL